MELWRRFIEKSIPDDVILTFDVRESESELYPLYEDVEAQFERLHQALRLADPDAMATQAKRPRPETDGAKAAR